MSHTTTITASAPAGLDISDIQSALAIIDYAAEQGAFKGWATINQVAGVRTRIAAFVEAVEATQKAAAEAAAAEAAPTGPTGPETTLTPEASA